METVALLIEKAIDQTHGISTKCAVEISADVEPECIVCVDPDRILQVLFNLLSNALKFSPPDSLITMTAKKTTSRVARLSVIDQGPGISEEMQSRLFQKFQQIASSDRTTKEGTGLGLAISKAIVANHKGDIGMSSVVGKGTTFWFERPLSETVK